MTKAGIFYIFLNTEIINSWGIDKTKTLRLGCLINKELRSLFIKPFGSEFPVLVIRLSLYFLLSGDKGGSECSFAPTVFQGKPQYWYI